MQTTTNFMRQFLGKEIWLSYSNKRIKIVPLSSYDISHIFCTTTDGTKYDFRQIRPHLELMNLLPTEPARLTNLMASRFEFYTLNYIKEYLDFDYSLFEVRSFFGLAPSIVDICKLIKKKRSEIK